MSQLFVYFDQTAVQVVGLVAAIILYIATRVIYAVFDGAVEKQYRADLLFILSIAFEAVLGGFCLIKLLISLGRFVIGLF